MSDRQRGLEAAAARDAAADRDPLYLIVQNSSDFIGISDLHGVPLYTNGAAMRMMGAADLDEMRATPVAEYFVPEDRAFVRDVVLPTVLNEGRWRGELRLQHFRTQAPIPIIYDVFLIRDPATGEPRHFATISRDISEDKRLEEARQAMSAQVERQARLFDTITDCACMMDASGRLQFANKSLLDVWGTTADAIRGKTFRQLDYPDELATKLEAQIAEVVRTGKPLAAETPYTSPTGVAGCYEYILNPLLDAGQRTEAIAVSARDVTVRQAAEQRMRESAERLRAALDAAAAGTFRWDFASDALTWDDSLDRLFGLEPGVTSRSLGQFVALVHPDDREGVTAGCLASRESGADFEMEFRVRWPDGSERWLYDRGKTFLVGGKPAYMTGACVDVTLRKQVEAAAQEASERLRLAVDATGVGTWDYNPETGTLLWDERCRELFGAMPDEIMTYERFSELTHPDDAELIAASMASAFDPSRVGPLNAEYRTRPAADGSVRWLHATGRTVFRDGVPVRFVGTVQDVTERKQAEQSLRDADRRKSEFLAILAHELRNPLAPIRTGLDVMRIAGDDVAKMTEVRAVMERQVAHMVRLIDDLMDLSRINHGRIVLERRCIDITRVIRSAVDASLPLINARRHEFTMHLQREAVLVDGDDTRIAQVISNLLNNAAHYTPPGGSIFLDLQSSPTHAIVRVRDSGVGIPADMQSRIFDSFTRLDATVGLAGGLGIGLTICAQLVKMHGGTIEVHSAGPGQGSEFVVNLPLVDPPADTPQKPGERPRHGARRIVVADDNRDAAAALALLLRTMGHHVRAIHHGEDVEAAVSDLGAQVVMLDIGMPDIDGYEVCRRLRRRAGGSKPPLIVAVTGWGQAEDKTRAREAGFDHHLVKPVDLAALDAVLARVDGA